MPTTQTPELERGFSGQALRDAPADRVLRALTRAGGALSTTELAYQTRLGPSALQDTLAELEERGLVTPWAWTLGPESA